MSRLSIVVPVYDNAATLPALYSEFSAVFKMLRRVRGEIIFVDDGSRDDSFVVLTALAERDKRCKVIKLARNYGSHIAILAGLQFCQGDCAVIISADLQDPPSLIAEMFEHWEKGSPSVLAVREGRKDPLLTRLFAAIFYRMMRRFAVSEMPVGGFDFALIDRRIIDVLVSMREKNSHVMTQILWTGFSPEILHYKRQARPSGKSKWTFSKKLKLFIDSIAAFSYAPLRLVSLAGAVVAGVGFIYAAILIILRLTHGVAVEGWTSLMVVVLMVSGMQLLGLGVIGEYLWRNLDETRNRPIFLVDKTIGVAAGSSPGAGTVRRQVVKRTASA
jgi:dolichol-phosphate mannosyltransferase